jgi:hypothetical protein
MRQHTNKQLTEHFSLYEVIEGTLPISCVALNWKHFDQFSLSKFTEICKQVEIVRAYVREKYGPILFRVTSGFRCKEWELEQGRSGNSQHTIAALDIQFHGCEKEVSDKIMKDLEKKYWSVRTGWMGGFAIKRPTKELRGFIHFDNRGNFARWEY